MVAGDDWDCRVIEVAHGVQNRNTFIKLDDLEEWRRQQPDDIDLYSSFFRYYTDDPNLGAVLAGFGMDFDNEQNAERARKEALTVVKYLMDRYDIKEFDISIAFSGNKGFHIFVNRRVFGVEPHYWLHKIFKNMAEELIKMHGLKTLDLKIYDRRRLIRLMNSRHSKSGLHKIPLTLTELEKLNIDRIRSLAVKPRPITPRVEHVFSEKARNWFLHHKELVERQLAEKRAEFSSEDLKNIEVLPCVKKRLEIGAKEGERNLCTWQLASYFFKHGLSLNECLKIMRDWWSRIEQGLASFTWEECERSIRKVYEIGGYLIGCGSEFIENLCVGKDKCPIFVKKRAEEEIPKEVIDRAREILESGDPLRIEPSEDFDFKIARAITKIINEETKNLTVIIPYIDLINWPFKERRWLFNIFQTLIMTIASVNYRRRRIEGGVLYADKEDYETARRLWNSVAQQIIFRVSRTSQKILDILPENPEEAKTREELTEETGLSTVRVGEILSELAGAQLINERVRERDGKGRRAKEYWRIKVPVLEDIKIGEIKIEGDFYENRNFLISKPQNQFPSSEPKTFLGGEGENQFSSLKIKKFAGGLKPTSNPLLFLWRRIPPAEKCEYCATHSVEYEIATEDAVLRRCPICFEDMRRQFKKVEFREAGAGGC